MSFNSSSIDRIDSPQNCQLFFSRNDLKDASIEELNRLTLKIAHLCTRYQAGVFDTYANMITSEIARRDNLETRNFTIKENRKSRCWSKWSFVLALFAFLFSVGKYIVETFFAAK